MPLETVFLTHYILFLNHHIFLQHFKVSNILELKVSMIEKYHFRLIDVLSLSQNFHNVTNFTKKKNCFVPN